MKFLRAKRRILIIILSVILVSIVAIMLFLPLKLTVKAPKEYADKGRIIVSQNAVSIAGARIGKNGITKFKIKKGNYQVDLYLDNKPGAGETKTFDPQMVNFSRSKTVTFR